MGKYKHHTGAIAGGVNLSKSKTPHDSLMKYMPIDDKASGLFKMAKPYSMGASMRGPLDKHGMHKGPDMHGKKHDGPSKHGKMHDGPNKHGKMHKGPSQMDPMYNGKPGVQKDDFKQFASPASKKEDKKGQPLYQQELDPKKKKIVNKKLSKIENKKMLKVVTKKPPTPVPPRKERVQSFRPIKEKFLKKQ